MKVHLKANLTDTQLEVTLFEGLPDEPDGDLETLLLDAVRQVLAAHRASTRPTTPRPPAGPVLMPVEQRVHAATRNSEGVVR